MSPFLCCAVSSCSYSSNPVVRVPTQGAAPALELAAYMGKIPVLKMLLLHWSGEGEMTQGALNMALIHAVRMDKVVAVKLLLEHGADAAFRHFERSVVDFAVSKRVRNLLHAHLAGQTDVEIDPEDEALVLSNKDYLQHALTSLTKPWGRSKVMIVGDGRAGKTALARSLLGEDFRHTESTIGISQMTCDVKHAEIGSGGNNGDTAAAASGVGSGWEEYLKPDKELEAALAKIVAQRRGLAGDAHTGGDAAVWPPQGGEDSDTGSDADSVGSEQRGAGNDVDNGTAQSTGTRRRNRHRDRVRVQNDGSEDGAEDNDDTDASRKALVIDEGLVMKYLASLNNSTKFVISLFDYGGQSVFNVIHHLFLTRYGVYALVFNLEQLASPDVTVREGCLSTLSFWLNSIIMHTYDEVTGKTAPIFIVGSHKDVVPSAADHQHVSELLEQRFGQSVAWPSVVPYVDTSATVTASVGATINADVAAEAAHGPVGADVEAGAAAATSVANTANESPTGDSHAVSDGSGASPPATRALCFFPVDNRRGRRDTTIGALMRAIEASIDASDYVHAEHPLTWLRTMDRLTSSGQVYLSLHEVTEIATECDVAADAVEALLTFLHEMGIVMWHSDETLRDVVILDPIAYFVAPATTIICKHMSSASDGTRHVVDAHKLCNKAHYDSWMRMVHSGVADRDLLLQLLSDCGDQATVVLRLMVKFGLLVPLEPLNHGVNNEHSASINAELAHSTEECTSAVTTQQELSRSCEFLVPALLPTSPSTAVDTMKVTSSTGAGSAHEATFYLAFTCARDLSSGDNGTGSALVSLRDCAARGFLPRGLFERLLCKAVAWSRAASAQQHAMEQTAAGELEAQPYAQDIQQDGLVQDTTAYLSTEQFQPTVTVAPAAPAAVESIHQDSATLLAGLNTFTLQLHISQNVVAVKVLTGDAVHVRDVLHNLAQQILRECMRSLRCYVAVPMACNSGGKGPNGELALQLLSQEKALGSGGYIRCSSEW
jgi:GTPase SAR1 family protein